LEASKNETPIQSAHVSLAHSSSWLPNVGGLFFWEYLRMKTVDPLPLEPGHYQAIINEIDGFIRDSRNHVADLVEDGEIDAAVSLVNEIEQARSWVSHFETMRDNKDSAAMVADASAKMFRGIGKAIQENEVT